MASRAAAALVRSSGLRRPTNSIPGSIQARSNWQEIIRPSKNKYSGETVYEQPTDMAQRFYDNPKMGPFQAKYRAYEKPWMKRKRKQRNRVFNRNIRIIEDLTRFIHFVKDNKY